VTSSACSCAGISSAACASRDLVVKNNADAAAASPPQNLRREVRTRDVTSYLNGSGNKSFTVENAQSTYLRPRPSRPLKHDVATGLILITRPSCGRSLRDAGHDVVLASDGIAAIAELHGAEFDVLVLDLAVRGRDAFDVIKAARHLSPETEIIVVADEPELNVALECLRLGIFDLVKADNDTALTLSVGRAVERRHLRATTSLFQASQEIFASHDPETLPLTIVNIAARILEADDVALALPARSSTPGASGMLMCMRTSHSHAINEEIRQIAATEVGDDLATEVADRGAPVLLPEDLSGNRTLTNVHSSIVFPLMSGERRVGVLTISRISDPRPYRRTDLARASVLATQILLAVENAALVRRTIEAERLATVGQLAAGVAHEINNPLMYLLESSAHARDLLADILHNAAVAQTHAASEPLRRALNEATEALADVCDGGKRIDAIARDLRTLARGNTPSRENVDLKSAIRSAARVAGPRIRETARLELELGEEAEPLVVLGHAGRLAQVFVNLIVNAAQALGEQAPTPGAPKRFVNIRVKCERVVDGQGKTPHVVATVIDDGAGIDPAHIEHLFEPFFSTKSSTLGTGLGLSLTQSIVVEHAGTIQVSSDLGKGATFTVSFPLAAAVPAKSCAA
jgi:two-component system, NtrC family, sensor kinase